MKEIERDRGRERENKRMKKNPEIIVPTIFFSSLLLLARFLFIYLFASSSLSPSLVLFCESCDCKWYENIIVSLVYLLRLREWWRILYVYPLSDSLSIIPFLFLFNVNFLISSSFSSSLSASVFGALWCNCGKMLAEMPSQSREAKRSERQRERRRKKWRNKEKSDHQINKTGNVMRV